MSHSEPVGAMDASLEEMLESVFGDKVGPERVAEVEASGRWPESLWSTVASLGVPGIGIAEDRGGVGGGLADVVGVVRVAAAHAVPLPLASHHLAAWVAGEVGWELDDAPATLLIGHREEPECRPDGSGWRVRGAAEGSWARSVGHAVVPCRTADGDPRVAMVALTGDEVHRGTDLAGMPTDRVALDHAARVESLDMAGLHRRARLLGDAELVGLTEAMLELTLGYVRERVQFGRPLGAFQAVQAHVVALAQAAAMSRVALERATGAIDAGDGRFEADAAAVVIRQNAVHAATAAHQAHGAIGMTREYALQLLTRRVHAARQRWEPQSDAARRVGDDVAAAGSLARLVVGHPGEHTRSSEGEHA